MSFVPVMWVVWGLLVLAFIISKLYTSRLSRDEDDQLILDDSFDQVKNEQAAISSRLSKAQPIQRALLWIVIAASILVAAYYILDAVRQFQ